MTSKTQAVLADALRLGDAERADLATELLASLDGPSDPGAQASWKSEIQRRVQTIDAGTAELEPWDEVRRRIENEIRGK